MKKYISVFLLLLILLISAALFGGQEYAMASQTNAQTSYEELKKTNVTDIEVFNNYEINRINIDNTRYPYYETYIYKFTLEQDGFVKLLLTADNLTKATYTNSNYSEQDATISATVYRDSKLLFQVVPTITARSSGIKGETKDKVALDKGTYYVVLKTDKFMTGSKSSTLVEGEAGLILYYQSVKSDEQLRPSSVGSENPLTLDMTFYGLLTVPNPKDYYRFELKERSLVNINYLYESSRAKFLLYSGNRDVLLTRQFNGNNILNEDEILLEAGKYYISLEALTNGDGGRTTVEVNAKPYPLELKLRSKTKNSYIEVNTIDTPKEVRYLKGNLSQKDINSSRWRTAQLITDELKFGVNSTGYYTVRVVDDYGNMIMETIRVTVCDTTPPAKPKITGYKAGEYEVTGTAEKNAIVTVKYNNRSYTCQADSKGKYTCVIDSRLVKGAKVEVYAQDISGNVSNSKAVAVK
ncbi:MAG: hypothetical protein GX379_10155 [Clostridiales bacterium]|jgi:hypothetical protein|nr:hypothetical protein [Clostridiales bacterium]